MNIVSCILAFPALMMVPGTLMASGGEAPATEGQRLFKLRCAACHTDVPGKASPIGAPLQGVVGRRAGSVAGVRYSKRMAELNVTWSAATLDKFLADPRAMVPGTTMVAPPVRSAKERQDIVAYLAALR